MTKRTPLLAAIVLGVLTVAGCGSSAKVSNATTTLPRLSTAGPSTTAAATGPATLTTGPVPAVTGATDLSKEPIVAAGAAPAPTVLTFQDLVAGTGATPTVSDTVEVQYVGAFYTTGKVFDASWTDNGPATFPLSDVVPGFRDAIIGMKVGGRREIVIPPAYGYGTSGQPPTIPGNSTLVFVIDLLGVS
jgi:peptidylprolyl isomerase